MLAWAIALWQRGAATTGDVVLVCTFGLSILSATRDLAVALVDVTQHVARLTEAIATLLLPHELRDHREAEPLVKAGAAIVFNKVSFRYPGGLRVFERFSLRLQRRPTGWPRWAVRRRQIQPCSCCCSGFTTCSRVHIYHRWPGYLRGSRSRACARRFRWCRRTFRCSIASIMENIRYGRPTATDDEVLRAAIAARCDFVERLPEGIATMVGDRGVKLSGGQRQRIAIARAFLKDAPILLLDEATAALDSESEEAIREALARLMRGRTVIAIAHRLATLRNFDRVVMLKGGKIIEDGPPDRLMQGEGPYRELVTQEMNRLAAHAA